MESTHTLTNETCNGSNDACEGSDVQTATKRMKNHKQDNCSSNGVENSNEALSQHLSTSPSSNSYDGSVDTDIKENDDENRSSLKQPRDPKKKSCNSISLPRTPADTPMPVRRNALNKKRTPIDAKHNNNNDLVDDTEKSKETTTPRKGDDIDNSNKSSGSDDALTDAKSVNGKTSSKKKRQNHLNLVGASNERITNAASRRSDAMRRFSVSNATLRNVINSLLFSFTFYFFFSVHSSVLFNDFQMQIANAVFFLYLFYFHLLSKLHEFQEFI